MISHRGRRAHRGTAMLFLWVLRDLCERFLFGSADRAHKSPGSATSRVNFSRLRSCGQGRADDVNPGGGGMMADLTALGRAAALGVAAGMRSMAAPAALSRHLA